MRVLHVAEVSHGGVISLVQTFAEHQLDMGVDVHTLVPTDAPELAGHRHDWSPRRRSPLSLVRASSDLAATVREVRPDVVHLHSFFAGLLGRIRRLAPSAVVYQPHSWAFQALPLTAARAAVRGCEKLAGARTDALVVNCHDELSEGPRMSRGVDARVIGLPVDTEYFRPASSEERDHARRSLDLSGRVLLCVGRISRQKGQLELARHWEHAAIPETTLVFVGPGDADQVAAAAPTTYGRSLLFAGAQSNVRTWLQAADVCVQPSLYEGQSVAMAEALCSGDPVVITNVNGAREAVHPPGAEPAGAVVPVGDHPALLAGCGALLDDPALLARASQVARERALQQFETSAVIKRLSDTYARACAGGPTR